MKYNTGKRELIIDFLSSHSSESFTLEQICEKILEDGHGKSTVYRIASELVAEGRIRKISDERTRHCTYQYVGGDECHSHLHLKCRGCGRLIHLDSTISEYLADKILDARGFSLECGGMLFGQCESCILTKEGHI